MESHKHEETKALHAEMKVWHEEMKVWREDMKVWREEMEVWREEMKVWHNQISAETRDSSPEPEGSVISASDASESDSIGDRSELFGDAAADAYLFETGEMKDRSTFCQIYGLEVRQVLDLSKYRPSPKVFNVLTCIVRAKEYKSISVLDARATIKVQTGKPVSREVELAWHEYTLILQHNWGQTPDDPQSALGKAYNHFWEVHGEYQKGNIALGSSVFRAFMARRGIK
jgi:hypothetical protein